MLVVIASFAGAVDVEVIGLVVAHILSAIVASVVNVVVVIALIAPSCTILSLTVIAIFKNASSVIRVRESFRWAFFTSTIDVSKLGV